MRLREGPEPVVVFRADPAPLQPFQPNLSPAHRTVSVQNGWYGLVFKDWGGEVEKDEVAVAGAARIVNIMAVFHGVLVDIIGHARFRRCDLRYLLVVPIWGADGTSKKAALVSVLA